MAAKWPQLALKQGLQILRKFVIINQASTRIRTGDLLITNHIRVAWN